MSAVNGSIAARRNCDWTTGNRHWDDVDSVAYGSKATLSEVNFWAPSAASFRALQPGEMFLFKRLRGLT